MGGQQTHDVSPGHDDDFYRQEELPFLSPSALSLTEKRPAQAIYNDNVWLLLNVRHTLKRTTPVMVNPVSSATLSGSPLLTDKLPV